MLSSSQDQIREYFERNCDRLFVFLARPPVLFDGASWQRFRELRSTNACVYGDVIAELDQDGNVVNIIAAMVQ